MFFKKSPLKSSKHYFYVRLPSKKKVPAIWEKGRIFLPSEKISFSLKETKEVKRRLFFIEILLPYPPYKILLPPKKFFIEKLFPEERIKKKIAIFVGIGSFLSGFFFSSLNFALLWALLSIGAFLFYTYFSYKHLLIILFLLSFFLWYFFSLSSSFLLFSIFFLLSFLFQDRNLILHFLLSGIFFLLLWSTFSSSFYLWQKIRSLSSSSSPIQFPPPPYWRSFSFSL